MSKLSLTTASAASAKKWIHLLIESKVKKSTSTRTLDWFWLYFARKRVKTEKVERKIKSIVKNNYIFDEQKYAQWGERGSERESEWDGSAHKANYKSKDERSRVVFTRTRGIRAREQTHTLTHIGKRAPHLFVEERERVQNKEWKRKKSIEREWEWVCK